MSKERESRRRSPSIIARLMGMEELPPQHLANKQQRESSESYKRRTESLGPLRRSTSLDGCSYRKNPMEEQEFKDVFEVVETKKSSANSKLNEEEKIALFRQKVMDAKRFSTDEMFQGSKVLNDTLDVLESNKDLFLKCLQDPNSLYGKHLSEVQRQRRRSHCRHVAAKTTSEVRDCGSNDIGFRSDRDAISKIDTTSHKKYNGNSLLYPHQGGAHKARKSSPLRSENKEDKTIVPTRIVVLKPNLGMAQSVSKSFSSTRSFHTSPSNSSVLTELPNDVGRSATLRRKKNVSVDDVISVQKSEESREIAKKVTRRMKDSLNTGSLNLSPNGIKGYAGDESSCYASGTDSATESDITTLASRQSFHWNERQNTSSSHSSDLSSVNREAKKRLSERWKMSHRFEEVGLVGRSSTLGEVLAISDRKEKAEMLDIIFDQHGSSDRCVGIKGSAERACPVGISSKEGWKDGCIKNISRSRSLPGSSASSESPNKASMHCGPHRADRYLMPKEAVNLGRNRVVKSNSNQKEGTITCNSRSSARKSKLYLGIDNEVKDRAQEDEISKKQLKISVEEDAISKEKITISDASICNMADKILAVNEVDVKCEIMVTSEFPVEMEAEISDSITVRNDSPPRVLESLFAKETCGPFEEGSVSFCYAVHGAESPAHSKEADVEPEQPSPASVLEASFPDDMSFGSECFGSLSAELQGLRMQLQLLKFESEEYAEGMVAISSDEECEEASTEKVDNLREASIRIEKSCESSYIDDVLIDSGLDNSDPDTFMACPIDHSVFLKLENKYCDQTKWLRSERRLLFDRINMGIAEILKQSADPYPCVKPSARRVSPKRRTKDGLCELLESEEKKAKDENTAEKVMQREVQWWDLEGDLDAIGGEIEKVLLDELVVEFITV